MNESQPGQVISPTTTTPSVQAAVPAPDLHDEVAVQLHPSAPVPTSVPQPAAPQPQELPAPVPMPQPVTAEVSTPTPPYSVGETTPQSEVPESPVPDDMPAAQSANPASVYDMPRRGSSSLSHQEDDEADISWTATEAVQESKGRSWQVAYYLGAVFLGVVTYFLTRDYVSAAGVLFACLGLIFVGLKKPKEQAYALMDGMLRIGARVYQLQDFKAFSVDENSSTLNITLTPMKRFMPPIVLFVSSEQEDAVTDYLADYMPVEPHRPDPLEGFVKRMRF